MKGIRRFGIALALAAGLAASLVAGSSSAVAKAPKVLEFGTMVGVTEPYTGATNAIRGIPGGGLPWIISSGVGELSPDGKLEVNVRGLVLAKRLPVPAVNQGKNPIANFKAIVSCLSVDSTGAATTVNVTTGTFPATSTGNADIEATVALPSPCIAPIVFVTSPTGSWFAATGR
jgi:hypothetical protein